MTALLALNLKKNYLFFVPISNIFKWLMPKATGDESGGDESGGAEVAAPKSPVPQVVCYNVEIKITFSNFAHYPIIVSLHTMAKCFH